MASSAAAKKPTVGILSIGDMGLGVALLLRHHEYTVYTVAKGRSQHTLDRIKSARISTLDSDELLVADADIILSIVPPRDAVATARRVVEACKDPTAIKRRIDRVGTATLSKAPNLVYVDLNAISPRTAKNIANLFNAPVAPLPLPRRLSLSQSFSFRRRESDPVPTPIGVDFLDGAIIGNPPAVNADKTWKMPSLVVSGPNHRDVLPADLCRTLNMKVVGDQIGPASALKSCFASLTKGFIAISILSFTTAHTSGVLSHLVSHLEEFSPNLLAAARGGLTSMPPKAYRWVDEMRQINETFADVGGFTPAMLKVHPDRRDNHDRAPTPTSAPSGVFEGVADIYHLVANDTVLGHEKMHKRKRGTDVPDVVECIREGIEKKRRKGGSDEDLDLAWRGSWT